MRTNTAVQDDFNQASLKNLRLVVKLGFPTPFYVTSHAGIPNIPANRLDDALVNTSSLSQRFIPDQGRAEIGSMSFGVVDVGGAMTTELRAQLAAGNGVNEITVELYRGGNGMDWTDFRLEQTQQIDRDVTLKNKSYRFNCRDIQRSMKKDIFDLARTYLSAQLDEGAGTINVFDTSGFTLCDHPSSFGDGPSSDYIYGRIKYSNGFEIFRATGKTATTFTGVTRGLFGTDDITHALETGSTATRGVEVEEFAYLELPIPALAYALLTGVLINSSGLPQGGTIPAGWHLGIATADVDLASFRDIGEDWFDQTDYTKGFIPRFDVLKKTDGKKFIEQEVMLLAGAFMRVGADGKLYLKRMTGVIESADYVRELTQDNALFQGAIKHELSRVRNSLDVEWSYVHFSGEQSPTFIRRNILVDATSQAIHGTSKPFKLAFKGLHNSRHTYTTLINRFDALRDRFSGPPITTTVQLLPSENDLEVGDIVRVNFPNVLDFTAAGALDRSVEIERMSVDQKTGRVTAQVFGSTAKADPIADSGAGDNSELPDSWFTSTGTDANTPLSIDGAGILTASGSLTGGTTTRAVFYVDGPFTIAAGLTLTITGNVELRVKGHLQIDGTLTTAGGGMAADTAGFIGTSFGGDGKYLNAAWDADHRRPPVPVVGLHSAMPVLEIENNAGVLVGIPPDMRGSGGGVGADVWDLELSVYGTVAAGGTGGAGGGSIVTVSRGVAYGASGSTVLDGLDGSIGGTFGADEAGSGGGGAPGALVHLLDGSQVTFPILGGGNVVALYGESPINNGNVVTQGKAKASDPVDLGVSNARVAYVPDSREAYPDYESAEFTAAEAIASVPAFQPGHIGGSTDFTYSLNMVNGGGAQPGEIRLQGQTFEHPDGTSVSVASADIAIHTAYETTVVGRFYLMFSAVAGETRFGGVASDWGAGSPDDTRFLTVVHDSVNGWRARDNANVFYDFVPLATDCILAVCDRPTTDTTGIATIVPVTGGIGGVIGTPGNSTLVALVYKRAASAPSTPAVDDGSYNFGTSTLTPPSGWSTTPPASDGNPLYVSSGMFEIAGTSGTDNTVTWSAPAVLTSDGTDGDPGDPGGDGNSTYVALVYKRAASAPSTPAVDDGSYNFGTSTLTPPSGWSTTPPASDGNPLWVSVGLFEINGISGTDNTVTWSAPADMVSDGADGDPGDPGGDGNSVHVSTIYRRNATAPATPTGGSYNFTTNSLTEPTNWSESSPAFTNDPLWASTATWSVNGTTGTDSSTTWSTPVKLDEGILTIGTGLPDAINLTDINFGAGQGAVAIKVDSDGDLYTYENDSRVYASIATWKGNGANTDYQVMFEDKGQAGASDDPTGGSLDAWVDCHTADSNRSWVLDSGSGTEKQFNGTLIFRDKVSFTILATIPAVLIAEDS